MENHPTTTFKQKLLLVSLGLVLAIALTEVMSRLVLSRPKGAEFETVAELQRAMLAPGDEAKLRGNTHRSVPLRQIITPHPDDKIIYQLRDNLDVTFQGVPLTTNSCAMRGPERAVVKPPGVYRIALLGDSYAFGWGVEQDKIFAKVLEDNLNREFAGSPQIEVLNFAVPGYSTFQEVALFKETALDFSPDLVLVFFVQNDFGFPFYVRDVSQPGKIMNSVLFSKIFQSDANQLVKDEHQQLARYDANRSIKELFKATEEYGVPLLVAFNPHRGWKKDLNKLWAVRDNKQIRVIKLRDAYLQRIREQAIPEADLMLPNDEHPSAVRHGIFGGLLAERLREFVG